MTYSKPTGMRNTIETATDFGVHDSKCRTIGATVKTYEVTFEALPEGVYGYSKPPGDYYGWIPSATRNGQHYGASQSSRLCKTSAERDAAISKYLKDAAKRALKLAVKWE